MRYKVKGQFTFSLAVVTNVAVCLSLVLFGVEIGKVQPGVPGFWLGLFLGVSVLLYGQANYACGYDDAMEDVNEKAE
jgi:hypothetical protein